jgi:prepilin-type N-terminal cleavage/methylation domain-containing protein
MNIGPQLELPSRGSSIGARRAFSLIEMIGVLAVIAVLVAMLLPRWIKRIDLATSRAEVGNLLTVSNALVAQVLHGSGGVNLFDATTWQQPVANWTMLPVSKVTANARGYTRLYYVQENSIPPTGYSQDSQGTSGFSGPPQNLRAMVVSVLRGDGLDGGTCPYPSGGALSPTEFDRLWNLADGAKPSGGGWDSFHCRGDNFLVARVNYAPLFHHLLLLNRETNQVPAFTINDAGPQYINRVPNADNPGWDAYYLDGTVVGLCDTTGQPMTRYVIERDISFVWEDGKWRADILGMPESQTLADDFAQKAAEFLAAMRYGGANQGANQQGVVTAMYDFMFSYVFWANECPLFNTHGVSIEQVAEYRTLDWIGGKGSGAGNGGRLDSLSYNLVH